MWHGAFHASLTPTKELDGSPKNRVDIIGSWHVPARKKLPDHQFQHPNFIDGGSEVQNGIWSVEFYMRFSESMLELKVKARRTTRSSSKSTLFNGSQSVDRIEHKDKASLLPRASPSLSIAESFRKSLCFISVFHWLPNSLLEKCESMPPLTLLSLPFLCIFEVIDHVFYKPFFLPRTSISYGTCDSQSGSIITQSLCSHLGAALRSMMPQTKSNYPVF